MSSHMRSRLVSHDHIVRQVGGAKNIATTPAVLKINLLKRNRRDSIISNDNGSSAEKPQHCVLVLGKEQNLYPQVSSELLKSARIAHTARLGVGVA